jgi:carbohydrate-selective porin OprB
MPNHLFVSFSINQRCISRVSSTIILVIVMFLILPVSLSAQEAEKKETPTKSGFKDPGSMESPDGVVSELAQDDVDAGAVFTPPILDGAFQPWFDLKREWNKKYGLQLGLNYNALYQAASETSTDEDDAAGGRFQIQGMWTMLGRTTKNPGGISFRFEDRHRLGTQLAPTQLGSQFGSATITGTGFGDFDFTLTELAWRQTVLDGRMKFGLGKIAAASWYNAHSLSGALTGFQNSALRTSGSKPSVARGIGAVTGFRMGESFALLAGIHDANAVTSENPFDTIDEMEFYYSTELRWYPTSFERSRWDQVRLQLWYVDETDEGATPSDQGVSVTASRLFNDRYMPFLSAGISDGKASIIKSDVTVGIAFAFNTVHRAARDVLGVGFNWSDPSDDELQQQYTTELFYRFQLYKNLALTPSAQYIVNPAYDKEETEVWVAGFRGRLTF